MKVGDLVRRKRSDIQAHGARRSQPGWRHGWQREAVGIIIWRLGHPDGRILRVLEASGKIFEWEDWELEVMNEAR